MNQSLVILGRQPALGLAELERLHGASSLHPIDRQVAVLDVEPRNMQFARLGGTIKLAKVLGRVDTTAWPQIIRHLATKTVPPLLQDIPEGKIRLGLNVYGLRMTIAEVNRAGLEVKKYVKKAGRSVRVVPNTSLELSSAQTLHNQLTGPTGLEFVLVKDGSGTLIAEVVDVQDIDAYAARDQARPKRDARVGMLPPKLAQIIVNLAGNHVSAIPDEQQADVALSNRLSCILDPFCGTGVVLQEALLAGFAAYGTDLEPRMIDYSRANLTWLTEKHNVAGSFKLEVGDATDHSWSGFDMVAGETYLGRPFSAEPDAETLGQVMRDVDTIHRKFLKNMAKQTPADLHLCLAVPAWKTKNGFKHLPCLDSLEELGYTRMSFVHVRNEDLIYHRDDQFVGRELVVITRK
jgi:tRNA G10  N-methylase Trm11